MTRRVPIDALRAFVTLLVVGHHAALAYHPFAPAPAASLLTEPVWWTAFPVVDAHRTMAAALFTGWNDGFFMALMFLLSGLFCAPSAARKGPRGFLADRVRRLAIPFVVMAALLAPLAYYPSYLATASPAGVAGYARDWWGLRFWPAGPAWFLWVLLAFDAAAAAAFALRPGWASSAATRLARVLDRPVAAFGLLVGLSALVYVPMMLAVHPFHWTTVGPFAVQTSRVPLYALYFVAGVVIGASDRERGLFAADGRLARRWFLWVGAAVLAFAAATVAVIASMSPQAPRSVQAVSALLATVLCATSSLALSAVFVRFARRPSAAKESLATNAFAIYALHYPIVSWLQWALLGLALPGIAKAAAVTLAAIALSWALAAALRRSVLVRRVL
jgi:peptidoglycan/LPS O-acetylase OafA/YrhL